LVLPAYREEKVILETLQSLENQTGIDPAEFEVLVVANYPTSEKPSINEYDESGTKIGKHPDRTKEIADRFSQKTRIKILVIEQDFPNYQPNKTGEQEKFAGVGIATKLGLDLALIRQRNNPQIIGYYGADTLFDPNWVKECLKGFQEVGADAVRGRQQRTKIDSRIEDENGLHILPENQIINIRDLEERRYRYYHRLKIALNSEAVTLGKDSAKEAHGVATQTAGMYAHIGGMNIATGGEDIKNAQTVSEAGKIIQNNKMLAGAIGRIEKPRTVGGSYTQGLWSMYRAFQYGEGNLLDAEKNLLVDDPNNYCDKERALLEIQRSLNKFYEQDEIDSMLEKFFDEDEIAIIKKTKIENKDNYQQFFRSITEELGESFWKKFNEAYPSKRIEIKEAEEKLLHGI
jgi:glycosyltransferase involved in cell wall biosynthesis